MSSIPPNSKSSDDEWLANILPDDEVFETGTKKEVAQAMQTSSLVNRMDFAPGMKRELHTKEQLTQQVNKGSSSPSPLTEKTKKIAESHLPPDTDVDTDNEESQTK
jgi:hypothetical protein